MEKENNINFIVKEKIQRIIILANSSMVNKKKVFISDINDEWYFCNIEKIDVDDEMLYVKCFGPPKKNNTSPIIPIASIIKFDEIDGR